MKLSTLSSKRWKFDLWRLIKVSWPEGKQKVLLLFDCTVEMNAVIRFLLFPLIYIYKTYYKDTFVQWLLFMLINRRAPSAGGLCSTIPLLRSERKTKHLLSNKYLKQVLFQVLFYTVFGKWHWCNNVRVDLLIESHTDHSNYLLF